MAKQVIIREEGETLQLNEATLGYMKTPQGSLVQVMVEATEENMEMCMKFVLNTNNGYENYKGVITIYVEASSIFSIA